MQLFHQDLWLCAQDIGVELLPGLVPTHACSIATLRGTLWDSTPFVFVCVVGTSVWLYFWLVLSWLFAFTLVVCHVVVLVGQVTIIVGWALKRAIRFLSLLSRRSLAVTVTISWEHTLCCLSCFVSWHLAVVLARASHLCVIYSSLPSVARVLTSKACVLGKSLMLQLPSN